MNDRAKIIETALLAYTDRVALPATPERVRELAEFVEGHLAPEAPASVLEFSDQKLAAIRQHLLDVDELICTLPMPRRPRGSYFNAWGVLGELHSLIGRAWPVIDRAL